MAMPTTLDTSLIRASAPAEVAQYLQKLRPASSDEKITEDILQAIECGSILPSVFAVWLGVSRSPAVVKEAWKQKFSVQIRRAGTKRLSKFLRSSQWRQTWKCLGDTQGLLDLFSDFSVHEVLDVCLAISSSTKGQDLEAKRLKVTELLKALLPQLFPNTQHQTSDPRPLFKLYQRLVPGCTPDFVANVLDKTQKGEWTHFRNHFLFRSHPDTLRDLSLQTIFKDRAHGRQWLVSLTGKHPSTTGTYPRFSASMQFSLEVLRRLAKEEISTISDDDFLEDIVEPLAKRAIRKNITWAHTQEIIDLAVEYLEKHPAAAKKLEILYGRLLHVVAICWSRRSELFEKSFRALLLLWFKEHEHVEISDFEVLLMSVAKSRRYPLWRFCYKTVTGKDMDVEEDLKGAKGMLVPSLLEKLHPEQTLGLFTRLRNARGDNELIEKDNRSHIAGIASEQFAELADRLADEAKQIAKKCVEERKKKAISSSDQTQRTFYAQSMLFYAVASRSLQLYKEALEWSRRFVRDPLTAKALYQDYPDEVKILLCGIPTVLAKDVSSSIRSRVEEANEILLHMFETLRLALRQPSFELRHYSNSIGLFHDVVQERMSRSSGLKETLSLSDEEIYHIVWKDTVSLLVTVEEEALKSGLERLNANSARGILNYGRKENSELKDAAPSTYQFFDNLAKARDDLWCRFRPTVHPSAATLPTPFPRGLPVQHLTEPYLLTSPSLEIYAPYLAARASAAVFLSPSAALTPVPKDKDTLTAIGLFVDDYRYALQMLVPTSLEKEAKERIQQSWDHLAGPLSEPRMSTAEAIRYFRFPYPYTLIAKFWPKVPDADLVLGGWKAIFPKVDDPAEIEEWNPMPPQKEAIETRKLDPTYLDISFAIHTSTRYATIHSELNPLDPRIPGQDFTQNQIWSSWRVASEAEILAALLYLDTQNSDKSRILASPFPSPEDVRYPSVYLNEQFLSEIDTGSRRRAISYLKGHIKVVPPTLVAQLAENTINALGVADQSGPAFIKLEADAFLLIDVLSKSDRPGLASELIVKAIIKRPDASAWHRQLLCVTFLRRLPASEAYSCFENFANSIIAKLEEQENAKHAAKERAEKEKSDEVAKPTDNSSRQPFVKVTTVKFLAQLLQNSEFVSDDFSFSILSTIAQKASHMDIRKAVVDSLLNMLQTSPTDLAEKIFKVVETIIPLAGNLNERRPITEADWKTAEESLELPEVGDDFWDTSSPLRNALFNFYPSERTDVEHGEAYMKRIILPTIERLKNETAKWTSLFLRKHGIDEEAQKELNIPPVPASLDMWRRFLHLKSSYLPFSYLEEYVDCTIFNIAPPAAIKELNKKLNDDSVLQSSPSVQFWLQLYGTGPSINPKFPLTMLLEQTSALPEDIGLSTKQVQELFLKQFTALLWHDAPSYTHLNHLILSNLRPKRFDALWLGGHKPIVEAIIMYIETLRTRDWERDANRQPSVLPDTFPLRLWLLKYPQPDPVADATQLPLDAEQEAKCKALADQLAKTVDQICGRLYHKKFEQVKSAVGDHVSGMHRVVVGLYLGDIEKTRLSWLTRPDELRVELAAFLLEGQRGFKDDEGRKRVDRVLGSWRRSESEEVRRLG
ncbi:hypothetical protein K505DRAFT_272583, partial [Melanomma pulvis-pyrius CBS 109.77]